MTDEHVALVHKALAYCLGCRAIRRLNETAASQNTNTVPRVIERIVENAKNNRLDGSAILAAQLGNIPPGFDCRCMSCNGTIYSRYMTFEFRGVKMLVCGDCADTLKAEQESGRSKLKEAVRQSAGDFVRAGQLDPANQFVKKQLGQMPELCSNVGISMPSAPKAKSGRGVAPPVVSHASSTPAIVPAGKAPAAANWSLGLGIASLWPLGLLGAIPAVICGHNALKRIKESGGTLCGQGRAKTGLVLGYLTIALWLLIIIGAIASN
jgi:hypothetical protein